MSSIKFYYAPDVSLPTQRGHTGQASTLPECELSPQATAPVGDLRVEDFTNSNMELLLGIIRDLLSRVARLEERTAPIEDQIRLVVERSAKALGAKIIRIRHSLHQDHSGDESIFFRVVLPDSQCHRDRLFAATREVEGIVRTEIARFNDFERFPYFNYRSESEAKSHTEPEWE